MPLEDILNYRSFLLSTIKKLFPQVIKALSSQHDFDDKIKAAMHKAVILTTKQFIENLPNYNATAFGTKKEFDKTFKIN